MVQTQLQIPKCHRFSSTNNTVAKLPALLQLLTVRVSCHPLLSPSSRTVWCAVRSISTHVQCACCKSGTWESLAFRFVFKIKCKSCVRSTVMVATTFKVPIPYYLTWILSSLRRHLFHPCWFIQINPYNICHKLFQPPVEKQFQEFHPALTTTVSVCFRNKTPMKEGATLLFADEEVQIF